MECGWYMLHTSDFQRRLARSTLAYVIALAISSVTVCTHAWAGANDTATPSTRSGAMSSESIRSSGMQPKQLPYQEGPVPDGYVRQHRTHHLLWISGTAMLVVGWMPFFLGNSMYGYDASIVPLVGPWLNFAKEDQDSGGRLASAAFGGVQAVGAGLIVAGLLIDNPRFVRADLAGVQVSPIVGVGELGLRLSGHY